MRSLILLAVVFPAGCALLAVLAWLEDRYLAADTRASRRVAR